MEGFLRALTEFFNSILAAFTEKPASGPGILARPPDEAPPILSPQWNLPAAGEQYRPFIQNAANMYGVPFVILGKLLQQESGFRPDVISGSRTSPKGAQGIAQFMPDTARELGVNPLKPASAIPGAARYLSQLYDRFGNWRDALAAYNWGLGNVSRVRDFDLWPTETRNYVSSILKGTGY